MGLRNRPLILTAFAASFGLVVAAVVAVGHYRAEHSAIVVQSGQAGYLAPAALDRQWVTYSDDSTCADRAGGDGVSAVRLSSTQIAWFFSDSSLGPASPSTGFSRESGFVHNLLVLQTVRGTSSTLVTVTGGNACTGRNRRSHARSVVSPGIAGGPENQRYWTSDGLRLGSQVLHFYTRYLPGVLVPVATVIASFPVAALARDGTGPAYGEVARPSITRLPSYVPPGGGTPVVWGAALLRQGGTEYVYGWQNPGGGPASIRAYLARVQVSRLTRFSAWRFYAGGSTWAAAQASAQPLPAAAPVSPVIDTGFSVVAAAGRYWLVEQAGGLGGATIVAYPARAPWGPFLTTGAVLLYRDPAIGLKPADHYQVMYEARAEPSLSSQDALLISYNVNSLAVTAGCLPLSAYTNAVVQPRFVSVPMTDFSARRGTSSPLPASAGPPLPSPFPASGHQPQWFDSWTYRGGCPPLSPVAGLTAVRAGATIQVHWHALGPGVRYEVYLRPLGGAYARPHTTSRDSITLSGLTGGTRYQVRVVPENIHHHPGPGTTITVSALQGLE
jgi:hypothetical protein